MRIALSLLVLLSLIPAASADASPCNDTHKSIGGVVYVDGNACNDGSVTVCSPLKPTCAEYAWCTFCPGPVLW